MVSTARSVPKVAAILAVVAMVALAGCSSGGDGTTAADDAATDAPTDTNTRMADSTPSGTATPTDTGSTGGTDSSDDTDNSDTVSGVTGVASGHAAALRDADSYTAVLKIETSRTRAGRTSNTTARLRLESEGDTRYSNRSATGRRGSFSIETYTTGDETYQRQASTLTAPKYSYATKPYDNTNVTPIDASVVSRQQLLGAANITWTEEGQTTVGGVSTTHYSVDDPEAFGAARQNNVTVKRLSGDIYVDSDGIIRQLNLSYVLTGQTGNKVDFESDYRTTDVGSTTVTPPDWLEEAKQQTDS